ncbi:MAG: hypothetical protein RQ753_08355 [Desulfurivibrionaceae bacterium]|nr:hypothetical protein [Desulfobulbales bacterium]MDT8335696.1 hypothetical protein [Desulfurivibrionaceae bacterium]
MEKWQLAGIISSVSKRPTLILPIKKSPGNSKHPKKARWNSKVVIFLRSTIRKVTEVIALF